MVLAKNSYTNIIFSFGRLNQHGYSSGCFTSMATKDNPKMTDAENGVNPKTHLHDAKNLKLHRFKIKAKKTGNPQNDIFVYFQTRSLFAISKTFQNVGSRKIEFLN